MTTLDYQVNVTKQLKRRGSGEFAGTYCQQGVISQDCNMWARYIVNVPGSEEKPHATCGAHLSVAVRWIWRKYSAAAIVQEIPGAWRE